MALDDADRAEIKKLLTEQLTTPEIAGAFAKTIDGAIGKAISGLDIGAKIKEEFEKNKTPADQTPDADPPKGKDGKTPSVEESPAFRKLQDAFFKAEAARKAEEAKRKSQALENAVREGLIAGGADPRRVEAAIALLERRGVLKLDDKDTAGFTFRRDYGADEFVPAPAGAKEWLQTEEGKFFLPPTETKGTGGGAGGPLGSNNVRTAEQILREATIGPQAR